MPNRRRGCLLLTFALLAAAPLACSDDEPDQATTTTAADGSAGSSTTSAPTTTAPERTPIADQTPPTGTNGVRFDAGGTMWIADLNGGQIVAVDPQTGAILARLGAGAGVTTPDDLAFDADGRLWWTEYPGGHVGRIDDPFAADAESRFVAELGAGTNPIEITDDGRVFAARALVGKGLYELDPEGTAEPRLVVADPGHVNGFDVGPDGRLYAPVVDGGKVIAIDLETGAVADIATGLSLPVSVRWASDGRILVLSGAPAVVSAVDPKTGKVTEYAEATSVAADNMAFGPDGALYVTAFDKPTVSVVAKDGTVTTLQVGQP
jgi:streptogramin lyase